MARYNERTIILQSNLWAKNEGTDSYNICPKIQKSFTFMKILIYHLEHVCKKKNYTLYLAFKKLLRLQYFVKHIQCIS